MDSAAALLGAIKRGCPDCRQIRTLEVSCQEPEVTVFLAGFLLRMGAPLPVAGALSEIMIDRIRANLEGAAAQVVGLMSEHERVILATEIANVIAQIP